MKCTFNSNYKQYHSELSVLQAFRGFPSIKIFHGDFHLIIWFQLGNKIIVDKGKIHLNTVTDTNYFDGRIFKLFKRIVRYQKMIIFFHINLEETNNTKILM